MTTTKTNDKAIAAFLAHKAEIDAMLARLQALSADHFHASPDEINWGHVGSLEQIATLLKRVTDFASGEPDASV